MSTEKPELRIGLVLNGGVSLAVWISGVVHEIDRLRRAPGPRPGDDVAGYRCALDGGQARVDVIAGASAGGINGALLAAAIQGSRKDSTPKPMRDPQGKPLRDVWLDMGDLGRLIRPSNVTDPRSLMKGDEYFLPTLERVLGGLLGPAEGSAVDHPLYLYLTSTALRTTRVAAFATSFGTIEEPDHRVIFRFSAGDDVAVVPPQDGAVLADELPLDDSQVKSLARTARATSSFPAAFPPHEALMRQSGDKAVKTFLIDGGILDNQPFGPVLQRVGTMPVSGDWRRVLLYVVPYVTEKAKSEATGDPGIVEVVGASGLARDLAKLTSLERVEQARVDGEAAAQATDALHDPAHRDRILEAAAGLLATYRDVQARELMQTLQQWMRSPPSFGTGALGGREMDAGTQAQIPVRLDYTAEELAQLETMLPPEDWAIAVQGWMSAGGTPWCWGLSKAERFARGALRALADHEVPENNRQRFEKVRRDARELISNALREVREGMGERKRRFFDAWDRSEADGVRAFRASHEAMGERLEAVDAALTALIKASAGALGDDPAAFRARLAAAEVVANAVGTRPAPPPRFELFRVSAEGPVLGHPATTPQEKLAGMELGHFAAFIKRSWRANDWMWGRLDGVTWLGRILFEDEDRRREWVEEQQIEILREELVHVADAVDVDERQNFSRTAELALWRLKHATALERLKDRSEIGDDEVLQVFRDCRLGESAERVMTEAGSRGGVALVTRLANVASRALSGAGGGLPGPARGAVGATRRTVGATNALAVTFARAPAFGIALVLAVAALAIVLATTSSSGAWLSPVLVALALLVAWTGFGWISSPPSRARGIVLLVLLAVLAVVMWTTLTSDGQLDGGGPWPYVWLALGIAAVLAGAVQCVRYLMGSSAPDMALALKVRGSIGYVLLVLLGMTLITYAWDRVTAAGDDDTPAWIEWFAAHETLQVGLVVFVVACLVLPLAELVLSAGTPPGTHRARLRERLRGARAGWRSPGAG